MLRCNGCWSELEGKSVVTSCHHLFCLKCAQQIVENDTGCPICESVISKNTVKVIQCTQDLAACQLLLCGQSPETTFASALASVQFYIAQQQLQAELKESQLNKKVNKVQEACRKKLEEVHSGYVQAKRKYEDMLRANQQLQMDQQDLQAKYAQKAMQARKLQEALKKAQQENESLRQNVAVLSNGAHVRSMSPSMAPQGHTITTVKRTEAVLNMSSPPNLFATTMQPGALPTSGRVHGMTGGYRGSQGNGGAAGFLGGSMDPNSPGGFLGGGAQGLRRPSSGTSFGAGGGGGGAPQHCTGVLVPGSQHQHNQGLRKMLGMQPQMNGMGANRSVGGGRADDLFSL